MTLNLSRRGELWTREEHDQLVSEMNADMSLAEMAEAHGRTPWAIIGRLQSLGVLVLGKSGYHRVDADPWILTDESRKISTATKQEQ